MGDRNRPIVDFNIPCVPLSVNRNCTPGLLPDQKTGMLREPLPNLRA